MLNAKTIGISIKRPAEVVYEFLLEPTNFTKWAFAHGAAMTHLGGQDWAVETTVGPRTIRFAKRNDFMVLDHFILRHEGDTPHPIGMRIIPNGEGAELVYIYFQRADVSEAEWNSTFEWVNADLLALKSLLETERNP